MDDARVAVSLTLGQASAVCEGLDLHSRIVMGQVREIATLMRTGEMRVRDDAAPGGFRVARVEESDQVEELMRQVANVLGHPPGGSFGIGAEAIGQAARRTYEVKKALEKAVADHRNPGGNFTANDGIIVRYTQDPLPTARIEETVGAAIDVETDGAA